MDTIENFVLHMCNTGHLEAAGYSDSEILSLAAARGLVLHEDHLKAHFSKINIEEMAVCDAVFFPDNEKREGRAKELSNDCNHMLSILKMQAEEIKALFQELNAEFQRLYSGIEKEVPTLEKIELADGFSFSVVKRLAVFIGSIMVFGGAVWAMKTAAVAYLISTGSIGAAALAPLAGFTLGIGLSIVAGVIIIVVAVLLLVDAIKGYVRRDELRKAIIELCRPRINLKRAEMINDALLSNIRFLKQELRDLKDVGGDEKKISIRLESTVRSFRNSIEHISHYAASEELRRLDYTRDSWRDEDENPRF